jgi:hypothetical protein
MNSGIFLTEISDNIFQIIRNFENIKKKKVRLYVSVKNVIDIESKILKELSDNNLIYPNSDKIKGSYEELRDIIWDCVIKHDTPDTNKSDNSTETYKKKTDIIELFLEFIDLNKASYNNKIIKTTDVHLEFNKFLNINNSNMECKYNKLLSLLKQHYNVKTRSHEFEDGISQGICFPSLIKDETNIIQNPEWTNPLEKWLNTNYTVTKLQKDRITCEDLYKIYIKSSNTFITQKQFGQFMVILDHKSKSLHGVRYYVGLKALNDLEKNNSTEIPKVNEVEYTPSNIDYSLSNICKNDINDIDEYGLSNMNKKNFQECFKKFNSSIKPN